MANNEYINKVEYGNDTLIDLTSDTVTENTLIEGYTAHTRSGATITGTLGDATTSTHGLMSSTDKTKLDGIATGANKPVILTYGTSTWNDFITAYTSGATIYCYAETDDIGQYRVAQLAYVNDKTNPTLAQFQYYRSKSGKTTSSLCDELFQYSLDSTNGWYTHIRYTGPKTIAATNGISVSFSNNNMTISGVEATTSTAGLMSTADKTKLNGIEEIDPYETINTPATLIHLTDAAETTVKELEIEMNPVQDFNGYDHPWVGGTQKNLFPQANISGTKRIEVNNLNISAGTYTFGAEVTSTDTDQNYCLILFYHDNTQVAYLQATRSSSGSRYTETVTFSDIVTKIDFYASGGWDDSEGDTFAFKNIQLETGSTATDYEPYENVCPISGWNTINICNTKFNCYPEKWISDGHGINDAGNVAATSSSSLRTDFFPIKANITYYYNFPALTGSSKNNIFWYDINKRFIRVDKDATSFQVTSPYNAAYAKLATSAAYNNASCVYNNDICLNIYDETRNGEYEAYQGHEYEISLPQTVYGGKLTVYGDGSGELIIDKKFHHLTANDTINLATRQVNGYNRFIFAPSSGNVKYNSTKYLACDKLPKVTSANPDIGIIGINAANVSFLSNLSTIEAFKEWLTEIGGLDMVYELETPITYQLTSPQIQTLLSKNNIWANSGNINKIIYVKDSNGLISGADKAIIDRLVSNNPQNKYWKDDGTLDSPIAILEYGVSTWSDFLAAYNSNKAVYCKVNISGAEYRIAELRYKDNNKAEFHYYRSNDNSNNGDNIFIYILNTQSEWSTDERDVGVPVMTGATSSSNGTKGLVPAPTSSDMYKFLAGDGTYKNGGLPMVILSYGYSSWNDFITAYTNNVIVYCRASSNDNPASGSQTRLGFMAYVNNATTPTEVEFQYYRSLSSHSITKMGDEIFVYKLTSSGTWTVTKRYASLREIKIGTNGNLSVSWSNNQATIDGGLPAVTSDDNGKILKVVDGAWALVNS